jgi:hypothetical protein
MVTGRMKQITVFLTETCRKEAGLQGNINL